MALQVATLFGVLRLDDSDYKQKLQAAQTDTRSLGQTLQNQGRQLQNFGAGMTAFFAPVGVVMGYAIAQTQQFDRSMSNVNAILGITGDEAAALRAELLRIGSGTVAGPQGVIQAFYEISSGVLDTTTHMAILNAAIETSEAGQADLQATTSALISTMNAYGFAASDAAYVSDVFTRTVGMGVLTMDELASSIPEVVSLAAQFGIGLDEVGGSMAYLTAQGFSSGQSATFMKSMFTTLLNPTADLASAITALGFESGAALLESEGLVGAYQLLAAQNGRLDGLITNAEALQGALVLTNDGASAFMTTYNEGIDGATARAGAIQDQTEGWDRMKSALDGLAIVIGSSVMPILSDLVVNHITPMIQAAADWMVQNPELTQQIVMLVGALVVAGPVIGMIGTVMTFAAGTITAVSAAGSALAVVFGVMASPVVALSLIIAGFVFLINRPGGLIGSLQEAATIAMGLITQLNTIINLASGLNPTNEQTASGLIGATAGGGDWMSALFGGRVMAAVEGARADGGDVNAGGRYLVGERGPEMFVPRANGTILPNGEGGGGGDTYNVTIYANSEAEGAAAKRGFNSVKDVRRSRGVTLNG